MKELKTMIRAYHEAGISVVIDVVYNHSYSTEHGPFQNTVPDYYYRMEPDGRFKMGQVSVMRRQVSMKYAAST